MFKKKKKKINFNIVLCIHSPILKKSIENSIYTNPEYEDVYNFNIIEIFYLGRPCIEYIRNNIDNIDLVIIDSDLEGLNGYEVCRLIRERYNTIPLLLFSNNKNKLKKAKEYYFIDEILIHPWQPSYLWTRINNIIKNKFLKTGGNEK